MPLVHLGDDLEAPTVAIVDEAAEAYFNPPSTNGALAERAG